MKVMLDCVTVGASVLDTFVELTNVHHHLDRHSPSGQDACFPLGAKLDVRTIVQQSGGGATNSAVTFVRQHLEVAIVSKMGNDTAGTFICQELADEHLTTKHLMTVQGGKTGQSVILVDADAQRTVFTDRGSAGHITLSDLSILSSIQSRWVYLTSLNGQAESIDAVINWARASAVKVAWNPGLADLRLSKRRLTDWVKQTSLIILNLEEARELLDDKRDLEDAALAIHRLGASRVLVSNGPKPLAAVDNGKQWTLTPHKIKAVDETGAGDALGSGTVAGLLRGQTFRQAAEFGLANSEHVIGSIGAKTGIMY